MSQTQEFDAEQKKVLAQVEKLLRLAGNNTNEAEATAAANKAQELLLAYNLTTAALGGADSGARADEKLRGGFYEYERDLWRSVAELNFCYHWHQSQYVTRPEKDAARAKVQAYGEFARKYRKEFRHRLVGRIVNVQATRTMAEYLLSAVERLTREFLGLRDEETGEVVEFGASLRGRRAVSFREGCVQRVLEKIWDRRREQIAEERAREAEERRRAAEAGMSGAGSSSTAVTISSYRKSEEEANDDFMYGEGFSARVAADRARRAAALAAAEEEYTRWAAENPEEARKKEAEAERERKKEERRASRRTGRAPAQGKERDWSAYSAGHRAGDAIGLDQQVDSRSSPRMLR